MGQEEDLGPERRERFLAHQVPRCGAEARQRQDPQDFAAAAAEFATQRTALERELVIAKAGLPEELHEFVTGTTQEELETSAAKLAKFVKPEPKQPAPKGDLNGGLNKRDDDDSGNAVAASVARIRAARSAI